MARLHKHDAYFPWHESRANSRDSLQNYRWKSNALCPFPAPWKAGWATDGVHERFFAGAILEVDE